MDELVLILTKINSNLTGILFLLCILTIVIIFKKTSIDTYWIQCINDKLRDIHTAIENYKRK